MLVNIFRAQGNRLVYSATVTSRQTHIATVDAGAMVFHDSIDLSAYAGDDAGSTLYLMGLYNSDGKAAFGYCGAVGAGEDLDDELISPINLTEGWGNTSATINDADTFTTTADGGYVNKMIGTLGKLNKYTFTVNVTAGTASLRNISTYIIGSGETGYWNCYGSTTHRIYNIGGGVGAVTDIVSISMKALKDVAATGLHLHSTKNGTDRKVTSVTSGFNPNTITAIKIWRAL